MKFFNLGPKTSEMRSIKMHKRSWIPIGSMRIRHTVKSRYSILYCTVPEKVKIDRKAGHVHRPFPLGEPIVCESYDASLLDNRRAHACNKRKAILKLFVLVQIKLNKKACHGYGTLPGQKSNTKCTVYL